MCCGLRLELVWLILYFMAAEEEELVRQMLTSNSTLLQAGRPLFVRNMWKDLQQAVIRLKN